MHFNSAIYYLTIATATFKVVNAATVRRQEAPVAKVAPQFQPLLDRCKRANLDKNDYELTAANWVKEDIDGWLAKYWGSKQDKSRGLVGELYLEFTGHRMGDESNCGINQGPGCVAVRCDSFFFDNPDHKKAFFALRAAGNLIEYLKAHWKALNMATWDTGINKENFIRQMSFDGELKQADNKFLAKELVMGASTAITAGLSFIPQAAPLSIVLKGVASAVSAYIGQDDGPKPNPFLAQARIGSYLATTTEASRNVLKDLVEELLTGNSFKMGDVDMSLATWLAKGTFIQVDSAALEEELRQYYQMVMGSKVLNALWKWDSTYIVAAGSPDCANDHQLRYGGGEQTEMAKAVKWCDPANNNVAYYIMSYGIKGKPYPQIIQPRGFRELPSFPEFRTREYPVTIQNIIESSVRHWENANKRNGVLADTSSVMTPATMGHSGVREKGASTPSIFTIPICASKSGWAMTSLSSDNMRQYPCTCDPDYARNWINTSSLNGLEHYPASIKPSTMEFLQAANFRNTDLDERYLNVYKFCTRKMAKKGGALPAKQPY